MSKIHAEARLPGRWLDVVCRTYILLSAPRPIEVRCRGHRRNGRALHRRVQPARYRCNPEQASPTTSSTMNDRRQWTGRCKGGRRFAHTSSARSSPFQIPHRGATLGGLPAPRRRITTRMACVFEVRDDKLAHERLDWDRANTCAKWGASPRCWRWRLGPQFRRRPSFGANGR
jgi:hypothetical protein